MDTIIAVGILVVCVAPALGVLAWCARAAVRWGGPSRALALAPLVPLLAGGIVVFDGVRHDSMGDGGSIAISTFALAKLFIAGLVGGALAAIVSRYDAVQRRPEPSGRHDRTA